MCSKTHVHSLFKFYFCILYADQIYASQNAWPVFMKVPYFIAV